MEAVPLVTRKPRLLAVVVRASLLTFLLTLLSFGVSLLLGIVGSVIFGAATHHLDMTHAYRHVAFPVAMVVAGVGLVATLVMEFRQYRRRLALWRGF